MDTPNHNPGTAHAAPPLSLYIHIPWCVRKCPYCDFNSHAVRDDIPENEYIDALLKDLESELPAIWGRRVISIFMGGGTPSLLSGHAIEKLLQGVRARLNLLADCEITLEANPGASDAERFAAYRDAGINRLSIGIQSFDNSKLESLGRIHNSDEAHATIEAAKLAGFDNINLDLMFGLPQQTLDQAVADVDIAIAQQTTHLSLYQLTIEPNTAFAVHPPVVPDDDALWDMQTAVQQKLAKAGYLNYEVSAYAQAGKQCRHNLNYWQFGDYLGIGAGAHSKITSHDNIRRHARRKHPRDYMQLAGKDGCLTEKRTLNENDLRFEFMLNALRLTQGFDMQQFALHTHLDPGSLEPWLEQAFNKGLLEQHGNMIRPTDKGRRYLNDTISLFLP